MENGGSLSGMTTPRLIHRNYALATLEFICFFANYLLKYFSAEKKSKELASENQQTNKIFSKRLIVVFHEHIFPIPTVFYK